MVVADKPTAHPLMTALPRRPVEPVAVGSAKGARGRHDSESGARAPAPSPAGAWPHHALPVDGPGYGYRPERPVTKSPRLSSLRRGGVLAVSPYTWRRGG